MAYAVYTTPAVVCGSKHSNTSDRSYLLFTRDAGMVWATARSVREERSRQRYALQDHSLVRVSLVKGKSGWRIGSVESIGNAYLSSTGRVGRTGVVAIIKFLRRFMHGEVPHQDLFDDVFTALPNLATCTDPALSDRWLTIFEARALYGLGYMAETAEVGELLPPMSLEQAVSGQALSVESIEKQLVHARNVSHL